MTKLNQNEKNALSVARKTFVIHTTLKEKEDIKDCNS
jgi:hypothetical protein